MRNWASPSSSGSPGARPSASSSGLSTQASPRAGMSRVVAPGVLQPGGHREVAAQRVARLHRLQRHQARAAALRVGRPRHRREHRGGDRPQAERARLVGERRRRRVVAHHHRVAAQQLARVARQPALEPVGEEADGGERGHGQRHRHHQQPQFTGAQVAPEGAPAQAPGGGGHAATLPDAQCLGG
jgi:hypothetical protein